jgi:hypothetical protein
VNLFLCVGAFLTESILKHECRPRTGRGWEPLTWAEWDRNDYQTTYYITERRKEIHRKTTTKTELTFEKAHDANPWSYDDDVDDDNDAGIWQDPWGREMISPSQSLYLHGAAQRGAAPNASSGIRIQDPALTEPMHTLPLRSDASVCIFRRGSSSCMRSWTLLHCSLALCSDVDRRFSAHYNTGTDLAADRTSIQMKWKIPPHEDKSKTKIKNKDSK